MLCLKRNIYKRACDMASLSARNYTMPTDILTSVHFDKGVKTITMCHKQTRNSLSIEMMETLIKNITNDERNPLLRVIVLASQGAVFSAGHNLKELDAVNGKQTLEKVFNTASLLMNTLINSPVPIIAKVDGLAAAAGCQLVAQCDIAMCTEKSTFSTPGANFGIFCSTPGIALARAVPKSLSLKMLLTGQPISSEEAKLYGLVTDICQSNEELNKKVNEICEAIKTKSRSVVQLGKQFYYRQVHLKIKEAYDVGGKTMVENLQMADGQEGIKSFKEKRKPVWTHTNRRI